MHALCFFSLSLLMTSFEIFCRYWGFKIRAPNIPTKIGGQFINLNNNQRAERWSKQPAQGIMPTPLCKMAVVHFHGFSLLFIYKLNNRDSIPSNIIPQNARFVKAFYLKYKNRIFAQLCKFQQKMPSGELSVWHWLGFVCLIIRHR